MNRRDCLAIADFIPGLNTTVIEEPVTNAAGVRTGTRHYLVAVDVQGRRLAGVQHTGADWGGDLARLVLGMRKDGLL